MNKEDIQLLYNYNSWANARILNAAANLAPEQFLSPASFSHGGLRETLVHTLFAEWIWRRRWEGISPTEWLAPADFPTLNSLRERWHTEDKALMSFVENLDDADLDRTISYETTGGKARQNIFWHLMAHVVNHGTQHRSEAAAILTAFGRSPGDIDLIVFLREEH